VNEFYLSWDLHHFFGAERGLRSQQTEATMR
jgi:hypothetical protein